MRSDSTLRSEAPSAVNSIVLTRSRVDASPEHLRPEFDGGTGVRTGRADLNTPVRLYPGFSLVQSGFTKDWGTQRG